MVDKIRCKSCGDVHYKDEECHPARLPASDPLVQEFRAKHGRAKQNEYYPECDLPYGEDNYI